LHSEAPAEIIKIPVSQRLPNNKASGKNIKSNLQEYCTSPVVAYIFDLSFSTGEVPELLKIA